MLVDEDAKKAGIMRALETMRENITKDTGNDLAVVHFSGHGTVIVIVQLDFHGHVTNATIRESGGEALDRAAMEAAKQWEFTPMMVQGNVVPGAASIRFEF